MESEECNGALHVGIANSVAIALGTVSSAAI